VPENYSMLAHLGSGYEPMAPGIPFHRRTGFEGVPGFDGGGMGALAAMAFTPQLHRLYGQVGMVPMGVGHDQNAYDPDAAPLHQMQLRAMQQAAEMDRHAMMQSFRGLAAVTGTPFGAEQRRASEGLTQSLVTAAPCSQVMPEVVDQLGGLRGSATVLANRVLDAGRYRIDPVTGRMGMSADTAGFLAQRLFADLYSPDRMSQMQGVTAGQAGGLFQSLQSRGMLGTGGGRGPLRPGPARRRPAGQALRAVAGPRPPPRPTCAGGQRLGVDLSRGTGGLSAQDLDRLSLDPRSPTACAAFDAERIKPLAALLRRRRLAMRDIFGDMGRPNAPMQELVQRPGGADPGGDGPDRPGPARHDGPPDAQPGPADGRHARQRPAPPAARRRPGPEMGLEPIFAVQAAQGALGFGGAYRAQGHAAFTAWGTMNADQVTQLDTNLRVQAAGSQHGQPPRRRHAPAATGPAASASRTPAATSRRLGPASTSGPTPPAAPAASWSATRSSSASWPGPPAATAGPAASAATTSRPCSRSATPTASSSSATG
jgi:hypothetical protein